MMIIILLLLSSSLLFPCTCHVLVCSKMPIFPTVFLTREQEERTVYSKYSMINLSTVKPCFKDTYLLYTDVSLLQTVCFVPGERKPLHFL